MIYLIRLSTKELSGRHELVGRTMAYSSVHFWKVRGISFAQAVFCHKVFWQEPLVPGHTLVRLVSLEPASNKVLAGLA